MFIIDVLDVLLGVYVKSKKVKVRFYIAQYPVLRTAQSALLHFTSLADLFTQTPSRLLWEASNHMLKLICERLLVHIVTTARYSFIQLSELEQCRVKKCAQVVVIYSLNVPSVLLIYTECSCYINTLFGFL